MNVLLVTAHPEARSLNGALRDVAIAELEQAGHEVRLSDLYALNWAPAVDRADFPALEAGIRLQPAAASQLGFAGGTLGAAALTLGLLLAGSLFAYRYSFPGSPFSVRYGSDSCTSCFTCWRSKWRPCC